MILYRPGRTRGKLAAGSQTLIDFSAHDLPFFERYRTRKSHGAPAAVSAPSSDHAGHSVWRHNKNIHQIVSNHEHLSDFGGRLRHVSLPRCGAYTSCRLYEALSAARHSGRELSRYGNTSSERSCTGNRILPYAGVCAMICWMDQKSFTRLTLTPDYRTTSEIQSTRLVGGSSAHYSRCGTVVRRFL